MGPKIEPTAMRKIVDIFIVPGSEESEKKDSKTIPKWSLEGRSRERWEKCKNKQNYEALARFSLPQGVENP